MSTNPNNVEVHTVPGTVHLIDLEGTMRTKHASGQSNIVLIPTPSNDPDDPLNWSRSRKLLSLTSVGLYTFMTGVSGSMLYSVILPLSQATDLSVSDLVAGTGYMFLALGWGCLFWQPFGLQYGKRPAYLISLFGALACAIWAPWATTSSQWIANKVLSGFFGSPIESLVEISITDIYFTHERGFYLAIYGLALAGSNFFAPVIAGFILDGMSWQWVLYWAAIIGGAVFLFLLLFLEETNYSRPMSTINDHELNGLDTRPKPQHQLVADENIKAEPSELTEVERSTIINVSRKTYLQKLRLFEPGVFSKPNKLLGMVLRPLYFLSFPVVFWCGVAYGSALGSPILVWFNVLNGTASVILASPPYNFSPSMVGLTYVSPLLGVFVAVIYTGNFGTWLITKMARERGGIMEPEYRLWLFLVSVVVLPGSLILWGVGAAHGVHWFGLIFSMFTLSITITIGLQVSCAYCIDSYHALGGEVIVTVMLIRNSMSFAVSYGITPWVENMGYQNAFLVAAFVGMAQVSTFLVLIKWGKKWRAANAKKYYKFVKERANDGMSH